MTNTPALPTVSGRDDRLEPYRRMWVLRLLDMALEEARGDGLIDEAVRMEFGQEAVAVGTATALRPGDIVNATAPHIRHAQHVGLALPLGRSSPRRLAKPAARRANPALPIGSKRWPTKAFWGSRPCSPSATPTRSG